MKIGQTVRFGVLSQQLEELEPYMGDTIREVLSNYKKYYVIDGKPNQPVRKMIMGHAKKIGLINLLKDGIKGATAL